MAMSISFPASSRARNRMPISLSFWISWIGGSTRFEFGEGRSPRPGSLHGTEILTRTTATRASLSSPAPWLPVILELKTRVEAVCDASFNSVLLNLYRDGADSMGWHSDDEPELGERPEIASLSLGATRRFRLRHRRRKDLEPVAIDLENGSLLIMKGETQRFWKHHVPKTKRVAESRVNLTFRNIWRAPSHGRGSVYIGRDAAS